MSELVEIYRAARKRTPQLAQFVLQSGGREALKWTAAALMVIDHINAYVFAWSQPWMHALGRLAFPVFGFVLVYNLAEHRSEPRFDRMLWRLLIFGVLAQPFSMMLRKNVMPDGSWWILNILFTFAVAVLIIRFTHKSTGFIAWLLPAGGIVLSGAVVEFHWFGIVFVVVSYYLCVNRTLVNLALWTVSCGALVLENGTWWALLVIPLIALGSLPSMSFQRTPWWGFYCFYVLHLAALWGLIRFVGVRF